MSDLTADLSTADLISYIESTGWGRQEGLWRGAQVWSFPEDQERELVIPVERGYRDSNALLSLAVRQLAHFEQRSLAATVSDITAGSADAQFFRVEPPTRSGVIPLSTATKALTGIQALYAHAAQSVADPALDRPGRRRSAIITEFLHHVILESTGAGSYIFAARVPLASGPGRVETLPRPVGRAVTERLHDIVLAANEAANTEEANEAYEVIALCTRLGLSAGMCDALGVLAGPAPGSPFTIAFAWARSEQTDRSAGAIRFDSSAARRLADFSEILKGSAAFGPASVTGTIIQLALKPRRVKVDGNLVRGGRMGEETNIWVALTLTQYIEVSRLHSTPGLRFQFLGELTRSRGRLELAARADGMHVFDQ